MKDIYKPKPDKVVGWIQARSYGSSTPGRMLWDLGGEPLCYWKFKVASECKFIDDIIIYTEDQRIKNIAREVSDKFIFVNRTYRQTADYLVVDHQKVIKELLGYDEFTFVDLVANFPLEKPESIDRLIERFYAFPGASRGWLYYPIGHNPAVYIMLNGFITPILEIPFSNRRQDYGNTFVKLGGTKISLFPGRQNSKIAYSKVSFEETIDVHTKEDLYLARCYIEKRNKNI